MSLTNEQIEFFNKQTAILLDHPEVKKMAQYVQHGDTSCLIHCLSVTYTSYKLAMKLHLNIDEISLIRGALLHDFFLYDWHGRSNHKRFHGFHHPKTALNNARKYFDINDIEADIIAHHMWPLTPMPPHTKEAYLVTFADKWCSIKETIKRPALRRLMVSYRTFIDNLLD